MVLQNRYCPGWMSEKEPVPQAQERREPPKAVPYRAQTGASASRFYPFPVLRKSEWFLPDGRTDWSVPSGHLQKSAGFRLCRMPHPSLPAEEFRPAVFPYTEFPSEVSWHSPPPAFALRPPPVDAAGSASLRNQAEKRETRNSIQTSPVLPH